MSISTKYAVLALLILFYVLALPFMRVPGDEQWILDVGRALLLLSIFAVLGLFSAGVRGAALGKATRQRFYSSLFVIVLYLGWGVSLLVLPIAE